MRHTDTRRRVGRRTGLMLGLLASMALAACGGPGEHTVQGTQLAPGADAHITADVDPDASTTRVAVNIEHLPPPDRIDAGSERFVVWQRPSSTAPWRRVGVLDYNADRRHGSLAETTVPYASFELLITVEKQSSAQSPSSAVVFAPTPIG